MRLVIKILGLLLIFFVSCSTRKENQKVKYKLEVIHYYNKDYSTGKWKRKGSEKRAYSKYDINGNEIESGSFGETWNKRSIKKTDDSTVFFISNLFVYPNKLNFVNFYKYNKKNQLIEEETWKYHNNKKFIMMNKSSFIYENNLLTKENIYDNNGTITSEINYNISNRNFVDTIILENQIIVLENSGKDLISKFYEKDFKIKKTITHYNTSISQSYEYIYDLSGKILKALFSLPYYTNDAETYSKLKPTEILFFYKNSYIFKKIHLNSKNKPSIVEYFNKNQKLTKIEHYEDGKLSGFVTYKYKYFH